MLPINETIPDEVRHGCLIHASIQDCFQAITTTDGWNSWFTSKIFIDLKIGGVLMFEWKNWGADHFSGGDHGSILDIKENEMLSFTWHPDQPDYATRVDLTLENASDGTVIRVSEQGFRDSPEGLHAMLQCAAGWGEALTYLKMYLEHGLQPK